MSDISPSAAAAREQARTSSGQFGTQGRTAPAPPDETPDWPIAVISVYDLVDGDIVFIDEGPLEVINAAGYIDDTPDGRQSVSVLTLDGERYTQQWREDADVVVLAFESHPGEDGDEFCCTACGRFSDVCSRTPCPAVQFDRID